MLSWHVAVRIDPAWVSPERFAEYQAAAGGDQDCASELYRWNAEVSAALFEVIHHFEVLLRNTIVAKLERNGQSPRLPPGTPWIQGEKAITEVASRLSKAGKEATAPRIYGGLTFGFWKTMFGNSPIYEELWRHSLNYVFGNARVDRATVAASLESVNQLRNRIAHHGSLIDHDTAVEVEKIIRLTGWIDPQAASWIRSIERVSEITGRRPVTPARNVVIVPAADAWDLYSNRKQSAYVFPVGRSLRSVEYLAFYADQEIKPVVPKVIGTLAAVDWNQANAKRLQKSSDDDEKKLGGVIAASRSCGWISTAYQVLLLSEPKDSRTVHLPQPIAHSKRGRGSAFARGHRYLSLAELQSANDTRDLNLAAN